MISFPYNKRSDLTLDLGNTPCAYPADQSKRQYSVISWEKALGFQVWDPRTYSDPSPRRPPPADSFLTNQCPGPISAPLPTRHREEPAAEPPVDYERQVKALPLPGTHSASSVLLCHPFPHLQNDARLAGPDETPTGNHSIGVEYHSTMPSPPSPQPASTTFKPMPRARPVIALDPAQPLRVDGKPRERVYVACERCRVRKMRCDGAQPTCYNCNKAKDKGAECVYPPDPPKRRGADKGKRIRSPIGQRRPRKPTACSGTGKPEGKHGDAGAFGDSATDGSSSVPSTPND